MGHKDPCQWPHAVISGEAVLGTGFWDEGTPGSSIMCVYIQSGVIYGLTVYLLSIGIILGNPSPPHQGHLMCIMQGRRKEFFKGGGEVFLNWILQKGSKYGYLLPKFPPSPSKSR